MLIAPATPLAAQWDGWKTGHQALKPACEVIVVAQKPMEKGAQWRNVVKHGVGGFNVKGAAVPCEQADRDAVDTSKYRGRIYGNGGNWPKAFALHVGGIGPAGRYPSNLAVSGEALGPELSRYWSIDAWAKEHVTECEDGLVAYCPKASRGEKEEGCYQLPVGNTAIGDMRPSGDSWERRGRAEQIGHNPHPTTKPVALVAWLLTLVMPSDGLCLDPFLGSGTMLVAAKRLGLRAIGIELNDTDDEPYCRIARKRVEAAKAPDRTLFSQTP